MELLIVLIIGFFGGLTVVLVRRRSRKSQITGSQDESNKETSGDETVKSFDQGLKMYRVKRFDDAFPVLLYHAEKGHTQACSLVAKMYYAGNGTEKDDDQYEFWMLQAAKGGDKAAKAISKRLAK